MQLSLTDEVPQNTAATTATNTAAAAAAAADGAASSNEDNKSKSPVLPVCNPGTLMALDSKRPGYVQVRICFASRRFCAFFIHLRGGSTLELAFCS